MTLTDTESLMTFAADAADHDLGLAAIGALGRERQLDYAMDFRCEGYGQWNASNRKLICAAFGVTTVESWLLPDATYVSAESANGELTVTPWRAATVSVMPGSARKATRRRQHRPMIPQLWAEPSRTCSPYASHRHDEPELPAATHLQPPLKRVGTALD